MILIGCVRTKKATASVASELFASPLFEGRRRYAVGSGRPWYILSAKFGLLAPGDVIGPYDVYLAAQSPGYRTAWGEFVTAQLEQHEHVLRGRRIEVHAGAADVDPLRGPRPPAGRCWPCPWRICARASNLPGTAGIARAPHRPRRRALVRPAHRTWPGCYQIPRERCRLRSCALAGITTC